MTVHTVSITEIGLYSATLLVAGHKMALFTQIVTFLAIVSVGVWSLVLMSTLLGRLARLKYKIRTQRR
jgi:hypothetical protein